MRDYRHCMLPIAPSVLSRVTCFFTIAFPHGPVQHQPHCPRLSIGHERNRFESSQATHLNCAVGLYFGLLV